jgi:hypothetical protein
MTASGSGQRVVSANGWNTRLYCLWIWYNAIAFATTPLTGRMLLWVLAPSALALPQQAQPA